jgi:hypothetical protein
MVSFEWEKKSIIRRTGSGVAFGLSDTITFAKQLIIDDDSQSYTWSLLDAE